MKEKDIFDGVFLKNLHHRQKQLLIYAAVKQSFHKIRTYFSWQNGMNYLKDTRLHGCF